MNLFRIWRLVVSHLDLIKKIEDKSARVVVIGIGYVGLPLVVEFARAGFRVTGYDKDPVKVRLLNSGESYIGDIATRDLAPFVQERAAQRVVAIPPCSARPTRSWSACRRRSTRPKTRTCASSPRPPRRSRRTSTRACSSSSSRRRTRAPRARSSFRRLTKGYEIGKDVFVAFSPERVDPGNAKYHTRNTPKVIGGTTPRCLDVAKALYSQIIDTLVPVSSTDSAEMVKLLENTFRAVNIALVNEVAMMSRRLGIDAWEVIRAAATKPFGFMPFYPGPGLGGHCIPIDPLYLSWKLRSLKFQARFIELADAINSAMPDYVVSRVTDALNSHKKAVNGAKILIAGVAYKPDVSDVRESPAFDVIEGLHRLGARRLVRRSARARGRRGARSRCKASRLSRASRLTTPS